MSEDSSTAVETGVPSAVDHPARLIVHPAEGESQQHWIVAVYRTVERQFRVDAPTKGIAEDALMDRLAEGYFREDEEADDGEEELDTSWPAEEGFR